MTPMTNDLHLLPLIERKGHVAHCKRFLAGLPASQITADSSKLAIVFYCLGSLDLLGVLEDETSPKERGSWQNWIWAQQSHGKSGSGFRPSPFMTSKESNCGDRPAEYGDYNKPHIIMTYTAFLSLAMLRDDFSKLDRPGIASFLRSCQRQDGSFSTVPGSIEFDLRTLYCAFAISDMLNDWSGIDIDSAVDFISKCRTYEGGYGQSPCCEAQGGTTYIAVASLALASYATKREYLALTERQLTIRWLLQNQHSSGGFCGRTGKLADTCYCFWCGAALKILGAYELVDSFALANFIGRCQSNFGGIAKSPEEYPDPYHTYLSLAALSMYHISAPGDDACQSWHFFELNPLLNARTETIAWIRKHVSLLS